jgi:FAD/FMN-containing dehydrogenase
MSGPVIINDVTGLNPIPVWAVVRPQSIADVQDAIRRAGGPISVGGGHFSMGGQTASPGSLHLDMRDLAGVTRFDPQDGSVHVLAGTRWCDLQRFLDPHDRAVKIMQTYANFTVGGALSVNCHGRYVGMGPVILSVRAIRLVTADGALHRASPSENSELFHAAIGGYGAIGVIVEAELDTAPNERVERSSVCMKTGEYLAWFREDVRGAEAAIFHNADLYPPHYSRLRATTWRRTERAATAPRLQTPRRHRMLEQYMMWTVTEWPFGKARRQYLLDPLLFAGRKVHWRNYEAGYDVAELEPPSRAARTYVLQEYFVPLDQFDAFVGRMANILARHRVNAVNVSVRHALADPGSLLAWARTECFAFVLYHKQRTRENAKGRVAVWTRELIDAVLACDGTYYLPYQVHATAEQFHRAYPRARELFALKARLDPDFRFRNALWDVYYQPDRSEAAAPPGSRFRAVFATQAGRDAFYAFLQTVFHLYPEDRLHHLIAEEVRRGGDDETIYRAIQARLPAIKPILSDFTHAIPALMTQKREMLRQTLALLGERKAIHGYMEIGSTGRYLSVLRKAVRISGPVFLIHDRAPTNSPVDILERGGLRKRGAFIANSDYDPIAPAQVPDASIEVATCYIGLHHADPGKVGAFAASIARCLKPGGLFILRDHDVQDGVMDDFVALVHDVFNAGTGVPWTDNAAEPRYFNTLAHWARLLDGVGLHESGARLLQVNDPSANTLMAFRKT